MFELVFELVFSFIMVFLNYICVVYLYGYRHVFENYIDFQKYVSRRFLVFVSKGLYKDLHDYF